MIVVPTSQQIAATLLAAYPSTALDVALDVVRKVCCQQQAVGVVVDREQRGRGWPMTLPSAAVVAAVCTRYDVTELAIRGRSRVHRNSHPRHVCWALLHYRLGISFYRIARDYERDHGTVMSGCKRINRVSSEWADINSLIDAALSVSELEAAE